jgi:hypothetical protein
VSDDLFARMSTRFGARGAIEYAIAIAHSHLLNRLMLALGVPSPSGDELEATIARVREGEIEEYGGRDRALREFVASPVVPPWVLDPSLPLYVRRS